MECTAAVPPHCSEAFIVRSLEHMFGEAKWKKAFTHHDDHVERAIGTGLVEKRKVKQAKTRIAAAHFTTS